MFWIMEVDDFDPAERVINFFYTLGQFLQYDDYKDIGKFDRLHHWQYGFVLEQIGVLLSFANLGRKLLNSFTKNPDPEQEEFINFINNF